MIGTARWIEHNTGYADGAHPPWLEHQTRAMPLRSGEPVEYRPYIFGSPISTNWTDLAPGLPNFWISDFGDVLDPRGDIFFRDTPAGPLIRGRSMGKTDSVPVIPTPGQKHDWYWETTAGGILTVYAEANPNTFYDEIWSGRFVSPHTNTNSLRKLERLRVLYHPGRDEEIIYPENPDRTIGYYHNPLRAKDQTFIKALQGGVVALDQERFDEVIIQEIWGVGDNRLAMLTEFFECLHMFTQEDPPLGLQMAWIPYDRSFAKHLIQPLSVGIGTAGREVHEVRSQLGSSVDAYVDKQVVFSFKLIKPTFLAESLLTAEGY